MTSWPGALTAITLFADDVAASKAFYEKVFGLPVTYEDEVSAVFTFGDTMVNLLLSTEAPELITPALVAPTASGSRMQFTLSVDDVDAKVADLVALGVEILNGPIDRPWGIRTAAFADPSGHVWELAK